MGNSEYDGAVARPEDETGAGVVAAFGRQLKLLRMRAGMDRSEFGGRMGYAAQSIASFEQGRHIAYAEVQGDSRLCTGRRKVYELESRYNLLRSQALTPSESLALIEKLRRDT